MSVTKVASRPDYLRRPAHLFPSARLAFKAYLEALALEPGEVVLLPAYVGWSPREGSGVFDPVTELGLAYEFYRVDRNLFLDLNDLERQLRSHRVRALVLIHYFGYVDVVAKQAVALAREHGAWVLEDEAHAMYSDLVGGVCGRWGDACIYSLHKMLPVATGGLGVSNNAETDLLAGRPPAALDLPSPWEYDLHEIARLRRRNADLLTSLLPPLEHEVVPLWPSPKPGEIPQTYPVIIKRVSRDQLYTVMNEAGFGVVSLYHTMIPQLTPDLFPDSYWLSRHIMNLPVHQDATPESLERLVEFLGQAVRQMPDA